MIVALAENCPIFESAGEAELHRFLYTIATRRHLLVSPDPVKLRKIIPSHVWRLYGDVITQSYKGATNIRRRWTWHVDCASCVPHSIGDYYSLSTLLVVENNSSDGEWVRMVVNKIRPALRQCMSGSQPPLDIRQAGGIGEIPKELRKLAAQRAASRPTAGLPLRIVAICDSDSDAPRQLSAQARDVQRVATELGASSFVLSKRSIENYIPDDALRAYGETRTDRRPAVEYIVSLTHVQRDHYPMKDGLRASHTDAGSVFATNSRLGIGLGDFIGDFLSTFSHTVTSDGLSKRDGKAELNQFLDTLEENL